MRISATLAALAAAGGLIAIPAVAASASVPSPIFNATVIASAEHLANHLVTNGVVVRGESVATGGHVFKVASSSGHEFTIAGTGLPKSAIGKPFTFTRISG